MTPAEAKAAVLAKFPDGYALRYRRGFQVWGDLGLGRAVRPLSGVCKTEDEAWIDAQRKWGTPDVGRSILLEAMKSLDQLRSLAQKTPTAS